MFMRLWSLLIPSSVQKVISCEKEVVNLLIQTILFSSSETLFSWKGFAPQYLFSVVSETVQIMFQGYRQSPTHYETPQMSRIR